MTALSPNHRPTRQEIESLFDPARLREIIAQAEEAEISIKTQLEFSELSHDQRVRRSDALAYWRAAERQARRQLLRVQAELGA